MYIPFIRNILIYALIILELAELVTEPRPLRSGIFPRAARNNGLPNRSGKTRAKD